MSTMRYDVITIGSATQDIYVFSKQFHVHDDPRTVTGKIEYFTFGTKIELDDILFEIGGGATNAALTLRRQGLRVGCIARVGTDDAGSEVDQWCNDERIGNFLVHDRTHRTGRAVIFLGRGGERTILVYRGAAHAFRLADFDALRRQKSAWYYMTSLGGNLTMLERVMRTAAARGVRTMVNPGMLELRGSQATSRRVLSAADILLLNREEASAYTKRAYSNINGILNELAKMQRGLVLVTEGRHGSYAVLNNRRYRGILKPVDAVDTTGAGDSFGSGFLAGYIRSHGDLKKSLLFGSANAVANVLVIGAKPGILPRVAAPKVKGFRFITLS